LATVRGPKKPIGQILLAHGLITQQQLDEALAIQKTNSTEKLGRILVDLGYVKDEDVLKAYAEQIGVPFVDLGHDSVDASALRLIPQSHAQRYNAVAIRRNGNRLTVAMAEPTNVFALDDIRMITGMDVEPVLAAPEQIATMQRRAGSDGGGGERVATAESDQSLQDAIQRLGVAGGGSTLDTAASMGSGTDEDMDKVTQLAEEAPIIRVVNVIIQRAIQQRASDIHVEPDRQGVRIRYRIDGVLHEVMKVPKYVHQPLVSRIKIMGDMNIAERRLPLDGRIHVRVEGKDYDLRVSTLPTVFGEKAVMRILDQSSVLIGLNKLGILPDTLADLETAVVQPNGMILVTGPTGSGKTTTLYAVLNKINSVEKNIITIEDPVEYQLPGINQVTVNRKAGLTFANAMRSFLRQDPDIIMVGEMRDLETAAIGVEAALTGHLVLSTLHTNDAPSAITRLVDMGVEPFLISASVICVLAQRLARKICTNCKEPYTPPMEALSKIGFTPSEGRELTFYRGRGCEQCMHTGYKGRLGIFELFLMNEELQELIVNRAPLSEIKDAAVAAGMKSLKLDGFTKVVEGVTTFEEVMRVVFTAGG